MNKTNTYVQNSWPTNKLNVNKAKEGEPLETKIERMLANKERIQGEAPLIYTERTEGVRPEFDPRTDRWEIAVEGSTKIQKSYNAKRAERHKKEDGKPEPTQGKPETGTGEAK